MEAVLWCNGAAVAMQFSSRCCITVAPLGRNGATVANSQKSPFPPFCLSVLYIAVVQRFTEHRHILLLRKQKFFLSEFLNLSRAVVGIFYFFFGILLNLYAMWNRA